MFKFLISNNEIDFDGVIQLRMLNPMFNDQMTHSYNVKTSNTERNKDIINQLHLPETNYNQVRFDASIITDAFSLTGSVYFNSVTDRFLDFRFNSNNDFWQRAAVSLKTIPIENIAEYFPIMNSKFLDEFPLTASYRNYINALDFMTGEAITDETTAPVPFYRLMHIVDSILAHFKIHPAHNALALNADIAQLYLYNSVSNADYDFATQWPVDPDYVDHFTFTLSDNEYHFNSNLQHHIVDGSYVMVILTNVRPIQAFAQLSNKVFQASVVDDHNITLNVTPAIAHLTSDQPYYAYISRARYKTKGGFPGGVSNHIPGIDAGTFLHEIEKLFGVQFFIDESTNEVNIHFLRDILNSSEVIDVSEFSGPVTEQTVDVQDGFKLSYTNPDGDEYYSDHIKEITSQYNIKDPVYYKANLPLYDSITNDMRLVTSENAWYVYNRVWLQRLSPVWEFYSENILPMQTLSGKLAIQTKFSPLLTEIRGESVIVSGGIGGYGIFKFVAFIIPKIEKPGKFLCLNQTDDTDMRLFFYRGNYAHPIVSSEGPEITVTLPVCNNHVYDVNGNKLANANLSLSWDGEYGLYNTFYKEFIDLMVNHYREETRFINWPNWMFNSFAWWKRYRINHQNYLVKSIDIELTKQSIKINNTILIPVN